MRRHRIYCPTPLSPDTEVSLPAAAVRHVVQVLRLRQGDAVILFDGGGAEFPGTLTEVKKHAAQVTIGQPSYPPTESALKITLWHGVCRGSRMDSVIQKATELGVHTIQPVITEHGVVRLDANRIGKRLEHWSNVAISAAEQSGRCQIPTVAEPEDILQLFARADAATTKIIFDPTGKEPLEGVVMMGKTVIVCTGPEGGFSSTELAEADQAGFHRVGLGPRILRTETAPVVALSLVQHLAGGLRCVD